MCPILFQEKPQTILTSAISKESRFHLEHNSSRAWSSEQSQAEFSWEVVVWPASGGEKWAQHCHSSSLCFNKPVSLSSFSYWVKELLQSWLQAASVISYSVQKVTKNLNSSSSRVYLHGSISPQHNWVPCSLEDWAALQNCWGDKPGFPTSAANTPD